MSLGAPLPELVDTVRGFWYGANRDSVPAILPGSGASEGMRPGFRRSPACPIRQIAGRSTEWMPALKSPESSAARSSWTREAPSEMSSSLLAPRERASDQTELQPLAVAMEAAAYREAGRLEAR